MRLLIDIDGTLRDTWGGVNAYILERCGVELPDVWESYDIARKTVGDELADEAFKAHCSTYTSEHWYPGAWSAMVSLRRHGVEPVFCTFNPWRQARSIARELAPLYGAMPYVERVMHSDNKLRVARRIGAVGIIEDKPSTLEAFKAAGFFTAAKDQPYNRHVETDCRFSDWRDVNLVCELHKRVWWQLSIESEAV